MKTSNDSIKPIAGAGQLKEQSSRPGGGSIPTICAMSDEYIEPTREGKRNLLLLIAICILFGAAMRFWLLPAYGEYIASLPKCDQIVWLRATLMVIISTPPLITLWAIPHAIRMVKLNRSPLPNTWVLRRTPIKRGRAVFLRAFALLLISVLALAIPVIGIQFMQSIPFAAALKICD